MYKYFFLLTTIAILSGCGSNSDRKKSEIIEGQGIVVRKGIVVSDHPRASGIGVEILKKGGNAIDAAIATELALSVCYPEAGNIGGGGFMVIRTSSGSVDAIDFREKAPDKASRDMYMDKSGKVTDGLSTDTHLACGVPGTIDGLITAHEKYGKLPFKDIIQPAIDLAANGFPLSSRQARSLNGNRKTFLERNAEKTEFVKDSLWKEGEILKQPELAETLGRIRDFGRDGFYSGLTADLIVREMERGNGIISGKDLKAYKSVWREPLTGYYRGYKIITICPPSSGGVILLQLLKMIENYPMKEMGFHTPESIHLMAEAERRAFADRAEFLGDPDFLHIPVMKLLDNQYLTESFKIIRDRTRLT
jgi:gamma-glutamyltranspeptidase/glutathione hydrolase